MTIYNYRKRSAGAEKRSSIGAFCAGNYATAFSLLEVMIAMAIFFTAVFSVLQLTTRNLRAARNLQVPQIDASSLAAEISLTNRLEEGSESGNFGELYRGYSWTREITMVGSNGLFRIDFRVQAPNTGPGSETALSFLLFRPDAAINSKFRR